MIGYKPHVPALGAEWIEDLVRRAVNAVRPEKILLLGSRARGDYRPDSDIGLWVIQKSNLARHQRAAPSCQALSCLPVELDVEVMFTRRQK